MAHDVFISYSSLDKPIADAVCGTLEGKKIRCWIAPRDVLPGLPYGEAIVEAIETSRVMVLVFSSNSNNSSQVMREVERAVSKGIPIIPLRIEQVPPSKSLEYFISAPHWLDALTPPLEKHLQSLAETVHILLVRLGKGCDSHEGGTGAVPGTMGEVAAKSNRPSPVKKPPASAAPLVKGPSPATRATPSAMSRKPVGHPQAVPPIRKSKALDTVPPILPANEPLTADALVDDTTTSPKGKSNKVLVFGIQDYPKLAGVVLALFVTIGIAISIFAWISRSRSGKLSNPLDASVGSPDNTTTQEKKKLPSLVPVSGKITFSFARRSLESGKMNLYVQDIIGGKVILIPKEKKLSDLTIMGSINSNGQYTLTTNGKEGAPLGIYKVTVMYTLWRSKDKGGPEDFFDTKFSNAQKTPLEMEVISNPSLGHYNLKLIDWATPTGVGIK